MLMSGLACFAQSSNEIRVFEETGSRDFEPPFKIYVTPQVCDVKYLSDDRQEYGPYYFKFKGTLDENLFTNLKNRAVYFAMKESDADAIIAMVPHSYISSEDENTLIVEISGYPAKYTNFRPLGSSDTDFESIITVYPTPQPAVGGAVATPPIAVPTPSDLIDKKGNK